VRRTFLLAASLVLVACDGSGDKRLSKEEYAKRADSICTRFNRQQPSLPSLQNVTVRQVEQLADKTVPLLDRTIRDLARLAPPKDEQALADRWLAALRRLRADAVKIRDRARANDLAGVAALVAPSQRDEQKAEQLAARLGTAVCSRPSTVP
jgi:hypothetical protein